MLYIGLCMLGAIIFGWLGEATANNRIFYLASVATELLNYFGLGWVRLNLSTGSQRPNRLIIVRPVALALLGITNLFELACFKMAGAEIFNTLSMADYRQVAQSLELTLGLICTLLYVLVTSSVILLEVLQAKKRSNSLRFKYRCYTTVIVVVNGLGYYGSELGRYTLFLATGKAAVLENLLKLRNGFAVIGYSSLVMLIFCDPLAFQCYNRQHQRQLRTYLQQLRWFYEYANRQFPASYRFWYENQFTNG
jgi:hypothetical protein